MFACRIVRREKAVKENWETAQDCCRFLIPVLNTNTLLREQAEVGGLIKVDSCSIESTTWDIE